MGKGDRGNNSDALGKGNAERTCRGRRESAREQEDGVLRCNKKRKKSEMEAGSIIMMFNRRGKKGD